MNVDLPGIQLEKLCAKARQEVLLTAPFIKASVLKQLLAMISTNVTVKCITRWHPEEILAGVSDIEVWSLLKERPQSSLWLRPDLHAKFYRADEQCLVGSANLTAKALGWSNSSNLELLVQLPASDPTLKIFEANLLASCVPVDDRIFEQMSATVRLLAEQYPDIKAFVSATANASEEECLPSAHVILIEAWLPSLRHPEDLYLAYSGKGERLTIVARDSAYKDLRSLSVIPNLSRTAFKACIGTLLIQKPLIQKVDSFLETPQRFGAVRDLLASLPCANVPDFNAEGAWQTLMRWLLYFLPHRYALSVPNHSEVFYRVDIDQ